MSLTRTIAQIALTHNLPAEALVEVLGSYNLLSLLPAVKEELLKLQKSSGDDATIIIESPFDLSKESVARIKRIVGNDLAKTELHINKDILSGFKARYKGKLYDGSGERIIKQLINHA